MEALRAVFGAGRSATSRVLAISWAERTARQERGRGRGWLPYPTSRPTACCGRRRVSAWTRGRINGRWARWNVNEITGSGRVHDRVLWARTSFCRRTIASAGSRRHGGRRTTSQTSAQSSLDDAVLVLAEDVGVAMGSCRRFEKLH
ncbi:hypothetical protein CJ030_MR7G000018 [Morella rubra]|uniref:Uncharacterized protein n=1 Tax=Morella rubra TaxID=262757 RepID=A0A6A1V2P7_9ROSI|nr:hypothetical protein CJ030_MR7G000018 [Morella rubra]